MRITVDGSCAVAVAGRLVSAISASSPSSVPGPAMTSPIAFDALVEPERALLDDVAAVGRLAGDEQHLALVHVAALRADRENAQRVAAEQPQRRHPLDE